MVNVREVDLTSCHLTEFPDSLLSMSSLTTIKLAKNDISQLPTNWLNLKNSLRGLDLQDNPLVTLNRTFAQLQNLETLNVADTSLSTFPHVISQLRQLKNLDISGNSVSVIPKSLSSLENLEDLNVSGCGLPGVPTVLARLPKLTVLDLSDNPLIGLPKQLPQAIPQVQKLSLRNCGFRFFPETLHHMKRLNKLDLSRNPITYIPDHMLQGTTLYSLVMCDCKLSAITRATLGVRHLDLTGNPILRIEEEAIEDLFDNQANIKLDLRHLQQPPGEVLQMGRESTLSYFQELHLDTALRTHIENVVILGETGCGKTSLAKTWTSGEPRLNLSEDRTVLYEQHALEYDRELHFHITDLGGHRAYELMYPVLMRDKSATAVVAVDLSTFKIRQSEKQLLQWLQMCIQNLDEKSRIIVVGTKGDLCEDVSRITGQIKEVLGHWIRKERDYVESILAQSSSILDHKKRESLLKVKAQLNQVDVSISVTSAYHNTGMDALLNVLLSKVDQNTNVLPKAWLHIYKFFAQKGDFANPIAPTGVIKALIEQELKPRNKRQRLSLCTSVNCVAFNEQTNAELVLRFLHDRGVILWYDRHPRLRDFVIANPSLLFDTAKVLFQENLTKSLVSNQLYCPFKDLTTQHEAVKRFSSSGVASNLLLRCLFYAHGYSELAQSVTLEVLCMIGVCYETESAYPGHGQSYYLPWFSRHCSSNTGNQIPFPSGTVWPGRIPMGHLELQGCFKFYKRIPLSLFEQLMVRVHSGLHPGCLLRSSPEWICFIQNGVTAHIQNEKNTDQSQIASLTIKTRANRNDTTELFKTFVKLCNDVQDLIEHCPSIIYDQYTVCPHCILTRIGNPEHLPIENLTMKTEMLRLTMKTTHCQFSQIPVPAALFFPQLLGKFWILTWSTEQGQPCQNGATVAAFVC